jgi:tRNA-specific 2-thiouridylase
MTEHPYNITLMEPSFEAYSPSGDPAHRIAVLMSGGVDSSLTAHLLKTAGLDVLGITMKIPVSCDTGKRGCCGADAALVCHQLGLPHYFVDVTDAFNHLIIDKFRTHYAQGRTPNPCVDCNTLLKFSLVWDLLADQFGISSVATGHYARVVHTDDGPRLQAAVDKSKDQSYFLYGITLEKLRHFRLPLGDLTKQQVRTAAKQLGLSVAEKPESMELCFAGETDYRNALDARQTDHPGMLVDMQGNELGQHKGIANYTLGQRRGLGFAGGKPLYVGRIDPVANIVALGTREEVSSRTVCADELSVLIPDELKTSRKLHAKIRSYGQAKPCTLISASDDDVHVEFDHLQFAPTPGQKLVLYDENDYIVAGGTITASS